MATRFTDLEYRVVCGHGVPVRSFVNNEAHSNAMGGLAIFSLYAPILPKAAPCVPHYPSPVEGSPKVMPLLRIAAGTLVCLPSTFPSGRPAEQPSRRASEH